MSDKLFNLNQFISETLEDGVDALMEKKLNMIALMVLTQSVELLGAFLDNKPLRARGQSKRRFNAALYQLFPGNYSRANRENRMYDSLRNQIAHVLLPGGTIKVFSQDHKEFKHLEIRDKQLVILLKSFQKDVINAARKVFSRIEAGDLKSKPMQVAYFQ